MQIVSWVEPQRNECFVLPAPLSSVFGLNRQFLPVWGCNLCQSSTVKLSVTLSTSRVGNPPTPPPPLNNRRVWPWRVGCPSLCLSPSPNTRHVPLCYAASCKYDTKRPHKGTPVLAAHNAAEPCRPHKAAACWEISTARRHTGRQSPRLARTVRRGNSCVPGYWCNAICSAVLDSQTEANSLHSPLFA